MNRFPVTLVTAGLGLLSTLPAQFGRRNAEPPKLENFRYESWTFDSDKSKTGEASYSIYLPKTHDHEDNQDRRFPWILWCPGFGGPEDFQTRGGAEVLDKLRGAGEIPELALVVFRAPGRRTTYMNGEPGGDIEDLIVSDLVKEVEGRFRVGKRRELRAIIGVSAGGFGAMKIALRHPDVFGAVATHSAAILPADPQELAGSAERRVMAMLRGGLKEQLGDPIDPDKWAEQMPMGLVARRKPKDLKGLQIYFDAGTDDHYGFFEPNQELAEAMQANGHRFCFRPVEEGGHAWGSPTMKDNVRHSLRFVGAALSGEDAVAAAKKDQGQKGDAKGKDDGGR